jgi:hypothetical protein
MRTPRIALVLVTLAALAWADPARAQVFRPQAPTGLTLTFQTERLGGSRVLVFGEVHNGSAQAYDHVVILAEGLDEGGQVVSRGRGWAGGVVPARGQAAFEVRMLSGGRERRYRVSIESYQVAVPVQSQ